MHHRLRGVIFLFLCLLLLPVSARAQAGAWATISVPNTDAFPRIETYLDIHDDQGKFVHSLQTSQIRVVEDDKTLPVAEANELRPGVQIVVAINPGPPMGVRNNQGISRYDIVKEALVAWANSRAGSTLDDWSLLITDGPEVSHTPDPAKWIETLEKSQVDARTAVPSLDTLFRAVSLANDPSSRPGMKRAVLFITPPPEAQMAQSLENLIAQAKQQKTAVFVWMVSSAGTFATASVKWLNDLASQTGGEFFAFTGQETLPNPEISLEAMRNIYQLKYQSAINSSGTHQLIVVVQNNAVQIETAPQSFQLDIRPPQPAFVTPPIQIKRAPPNGDTTNTAELPLSNLQPSEQKLQVIFDFPDGRKREIVRSSLYVDGAMVEEHVQPPFDQFSWKLDQYTTTGTHTLQIQALDELGLNGASVELPVQITVERPATNAWAAIQRNLPVLMGLAVLLAGAILLLVLVLGGRLRPGPHKAARSRRKFDPVTQPVTIQNEQPAPHLPNWVNRLQWPQRHLAPTAYAYLSRIAETDEAAVTPPMPVTSDEVTLGSDPKQATLVLDDPSIEPLHARLIRDQDNCFRLIDEGSIAGTWVNYAPVSQEGIKLEHGDLIHVGRIGFRFSLRQPGRVRKPVIILESSSQETSEEPRS